MNNCITELCEILESDPMIYEMMKQCPYEILKNITIKEYKQGTFVLEQGKQQDFFFIVVSGIFDIYIISENGKKYLMKTYNKGTYIGELEIFDDKPYVSQVEAKSDAKLIEIKRVDFLKWIESDRNFSQYIIKTLCRSTYTLCENVGNNTLYTLKQRICQYLIDNIEKNKSSKNVVLKTDSLGEQMAVTQRSINRVLKQLKEINAIDIKNSSIVVKNYELLINQRDC